MIYIFHKGINAQGVSPSKYATGIRDLILKAASGERESKEGIDLEDYVGLYDEQPWWGESFVFPWQGKLAVVGLPSENPAENMTLFKHIEGDAFRRIREDKTLGEELRFERDESGKVVRMWQHSNYNKRIK